MRNREGIPLTLRKVLVLSWASRLTRLKKGSKTDLIMGVIMEESHKM
jgi:hypothetical protein